MRSYVIPISLAPGAWLLSPLKGTKHLTWLQLIIQPYHCRAASIRMPGSTPETSINCNVDFDPSKVAEKTIIVTGGKEVSHYCYVWRHYRRESNDPSWLDSNLTAGANGLGEAYVRALHGAKWVRLWACIGDWGIITRRSGPMSL